jgi:hypothetical protein
MALFLPIQVDVEFTSLCLALHSMALAPISHPCLVRWGLFSTLKIKYQLHLRRRPTMIIDTIPEILIIGVLIIVGLRVLES